MNCCLRTDQLLYDNAKEYVQKHLDESFSADEGDQKNDLLARFDEEFPEPA